MDRIIAEIIIGALALSLLFCVIPIYRSNHELVQTAVSKADYSEKIKEVIRPEVSSGTDLYGAEVIAVIRYYALRGEVGITVVQNSDSREYRGESYREEVFTIDRDAVFSTACTYQDGSLQAIRFVRSS